MCALLDYYATYTDVSGQNIGPIFKGKETQGRVFLNSLTLLRRRCLKS